MKLVSVVAFSLSALVSAVVPAYALLLPFVFGLGFAAYGLGVSVSRRFSPLNDLPNALRVFLASLGGYSLTLTKSFLFPSAGILLLSAAIFLNDEFQRRAFDSVRSRRLGGSIAFLGIDGAGKSTHSAATRAWLTGRGYLSTVMPFHRYLFVERLAALSPKGRSADHSSPRGRRNPLRPLPSLFDNLILQISTSIGCRLEGRVVIYDRFIWSTFIKYSALGYPVKPLARVYLLPRPYFALVLDVPVEKSLRVIDERVTHVRYPRAVLSQEREQYLAIARKHGYPIIDATAPFEEVQKEIESHLSRLFPQAVRGRSAN